MNNPPPPGARLALEILNEHPEGITEEAWALEFYRRRYPPALRQVDWVEGVLTTEDVSIDFIDDGDLYVTSVGRALDDEEQSVYLGHEVHHAIAAMCLLDKPYGFTRADVDVLRATGNTDLFFIAARIEALLPSEEINGTLKGFDHDYLQEK
jgi:hypothetical protein